VVPLAVNVLSVTDAVQAINAVQEDIVASVDAESGMLVVTSATTGASSAVAAGGEVIRNHKPRPMGANAAALFGNGVSTGGTGLAITSSGSWELRELIQWKAPKLDVEGGADAKTKADHQQKKILYDELLILCPRISADDNQSSVSIRRTIGPLSKLCAINSTK
jgi:hypothetical protein